MYCRLLWARPGCLQRSCKRMWSVVRRKRLKRGLRAAAPDQLPPGTAPAPPAWALNRLHQTHVQLWMPERRPPRPGEQRQLAAAPDRQMPPLRSAARGGCGCAAPWPETDPPRPSNHTNTQNLEIQQGPRP